MVSCDTRRPSSLGNCHFSHPEICSGDQSCISLLATISRSVVSVASRHGLGRRADSQADVFSFCQLRFIQPELPVSTLVLRKTVPSWPLVHRVNPSAGLHEQLP